MSEFYKLQYLQDRPGAVSPVSFPSELGSVTLQAHVPEFVSKEVLDALWKFGEFRDTVTCGSILILEQSPDFVPVDMDEDIEEIPDLATYIQTSPDFVQKAIAESPTVITPVVEEPLLEEEVDEDDEEITTTEVKPEVIEGVVQTDEEITQEVKKNQVEEAESQYK